MDLPTSLEVVSLSYAIHAKDALCGTLKQPRSAMSIRIGNGVQDRDPTSNLSHAFQ